jgi:hypothetical protein
VADADGPGLVLPLEEVQSLGSVEEATTVVISDSRTTVHKGEMATLMTHKFQTFKNVPLLAA